MVPSGFLRDNLIFVCFYQLPITTEWPIVKRVIWWACWELTINMAIMVVKAKLAKHPLSLCRWNKKNLGWFCPIFCEGFQTLIVGKKIISK